MCCGSAVSQDCAKRILPQCLGSLSTAAPCRSPEVNIGAQEGSLLDEVTRREQAHNALQTKEILHIFLQVIDFWLTWPSARVHDTFNLAS